MKNELNIKDYILAALLAAVISVLALISIPLPISPVPITLQTLGVMLAGSILTKRQAGLSVLTYILLGLIGMPVFAGGRSGFGVLLGPSGGYLIGFFVGAILIAFIKGNSNNIIRLAIANFIGGVIVVNILGIAWRMISTDISFIPAVSSILPYLPGDIFKAFAATSLAFAVNNATIRVKKVSH